MIDWKAKSLGYTVLCENKLEVNATHLEERWAGAYALKATNRSLLVSKLACSRPFEAAPERTVMKPPTDERNQN